MNARILGTHQALFRYEHDPVEEDKGCSVWFFVFSPTQLLQFREVQAEKMATAAQTLRIKMKRLICGCYVPASCHVAFLVTTNQRHTVSLTWDMYGFQIPSLSTVTEL